MAQVDTIFALATPPGKSGVAVIRVSGPAALESLQKLLPSSAAFPPASRLANLTELYAPDVSRETFLIDKAIVIYFKAPNSFTGEDVVEYQLHGGPAIIRQMLDILAEMPKHRLAERGEFTRRAFENGRMDLTEAEAVADLIEAETLAQRDQALSQMQGSLRDLYEGWAERLTRCLAFLEADLDFPDEDLPDGVAAQVMPKLNELEAEMTVHLNDNRRGERLRDGVHIAVIGAPNAGKSSLVNALAQRDVAIVSDLAGTTRDVVEVHLDLGGYPVILADTAGLKPQLLQNVSRETLSGSHDEIESEGIRRALKRAQEADFKILLFDGSRELDEATLSLADVKALKVINKADLVSDMSEKDVVYLSLKNNQGIAEFLDILQDKIKHLIGREDTPALTRQRHRTAVQNCLESLAQAKVTALPELMAEDIRIAVRELGKITGRVNVDDLLDIIFSEFCIGK
jgi:tRNA modification GTPase